MDLNLDEGVAPRSVDAGRGFGWWTDAWALFMKNPGMWIVFGLILLVVMIVLGFIPLLGFLAVSLLVPVLTGGWMLAAAKLAAGGSLEVGDLFAGFKDKLNPLLVLGGLLLAASLVIGIVAGVLGAGAVMGGVMGGSSGHTGGMLAALGAGLFAVLISFALGAVVGMLIWFAPALVVFQGVAPVDALKQSLAACLKNIVAFVLFGVAYIIAAIIATIPFGLGWVVLVPVLMLTMYVSYKDVFGAV